VVDVNQIKDCGVLLHGIHCFCCRWSIQLFIVFLCPTGSNGHHYVHVNGTKLLTYKKKINETILNMLA
jgi:hypothetical protein